MKNMHIILGGILVIALLCNVGPVAALNENSAGTLGTGDISDDIAPYNGTISPDSPVYGLKLAMEDLDETFTFNEPSGWKNVLTMPNSALLKYGGNWTSTGQLLLNGLLRCTG
jgi:hypothetical protein